MPDIYLYGDIPVLKNKLGVRDEKMLDTIEAERSRGRMMVLYKEGFDDISPAGLREIHRVLFQDVYEWAGQYRVINIEKRERLLAGRSVWYSNDEDIPGELEATFREMYGLEWARLSKERFVHFLARYFSRLWQIHPFREGNTRTVVMMLTFFVERYGYYMDQELMAESAGYVRDAFVMASLGHHSEYEHLERILLDAVQEEMVLYHEDVPETALDEGREERYRKYRQERYKPQPHYKRED